MPELPEVETVRRGLESRTCGFLIDKVAVLRDRAIAHPGEPDAFCEALMGNTVTGWQRRGKYLIASLAGADMDDAGQWGVHLRITGQFLWLSEAAGPCSHTRVRLWNPQGEELRFVDTRSFGQMWWIPPGTPVEAVMTGLSRLGPEPFSADFNSSYLRQTLKKSARPIKTALLDQSLVAGVGNIYADESLFTAGISPHNPANQLTKAQREALVLALVEVLQASIGAGGTTFSDFRDLTGTNGNYGGMAWVYRRGGQACRRCGTTIRRDRLAGRSTHWCPVCQQ